MTATLEKRRSMRRTLERLRTGTPPSEGLALFTRDHRKLEANVLDFLGNHSATQRIGWVRGSYGAGKSHTLAAIREIATTAGFATSYVSLDGAGCAANHPQRMIASLLQNIEIAGIQGGYAALLQRLLGSTETARRFIVLVGSILSSSRNLDLQCNYLLSRLAEVKSNEEEAVGLIAEITGLLSGNTLSASSATPNVRMQAYQLLRIVQEAVRLDGGAGLVLELDEVESIFTKLTNSRARRGAYRVLAALGNWKGLAHTKLLLAITPDGDRWLQDDLVAQLYWVDAIDEEPVVTFARAVSSEERLVFDCKPFREGDVRDLLSLVGAIHRDAYGGIHNVSTASRAELLVDEGIQLAKGGLPPRHVLRHLVGGLDAIRYSAHDA